MSGASPHDWRWSLIMASPELSRKLGIPFSDLTSTQRLLGLVIAQHLPDSFPSYPLLAAETALDLRTVKRTAHELAELSRLRIDVGGGRIPNRYHPLMPNEGWSSASSGVAQGHPSRGSVPPQPWPSATRRSNRRGQLRVDDVELRPVPDQERFELLIRPLGRLTRAQAEEAFGAFAERPDGFAACAEMARSGQRPAALLLSLIRQGEHRTQRGKEPRITERRSGRCIECDICVDNGLYFGGQVYCAEHEERAA